MIDISKKSSKCVNFFEKIKKTVAKTVFLCYHCKAKGLYKVVEIEKTVYFGNLLELYGKLLSPVQQKVMFDYYEQDLTLSEIAENNNISRQAVYDTARKAQNKLLDFEEKVGALKQIEKLKERIDGNI